MVVYHHLWWIYLSWLKSGSNEKLSDSSKMSKSLHRKFRLTLVGNPLSRSFSGKPNLGIRLPISNLFYYEPITFYPVMTVRNWCHFYLYQVIPIQGDFDITKYRDNLTKNCNINMLKGIIWINMGIDLDVYNRSC